MPAQFPFRTQFSVVTLIVNLTKIAPYIAYGRARNK